MWVNVEPTTNGGFRSLFGKRPFTFSPAGLIGGLTYDAANSRYTVSFYATTSGAGWEISGTNITGAFVPVNTWTHLAFVRNGSDFSLYVNGTRYSFATSSGTIVANNNNWVIGSSATNDTAVFAGYMDDFRFTRGLARYTTAFTPPGSHPTRGPDANFASVQLLIKAEGANNSTSFVDSSSLGATITAVGGAKISTVQKRYGGSSAYFDGAGDYLTVSNNSRYYLSSGDFTVEAWVYRQAAGRRVIVSQTQNSSAPYNGWLFYINSSNQLTFEGTNGSSISAASMPTSSQWVHVAAVRSGSTTTIYMDGVQVASGTVSITDFNGTLTIGQYTSPISGSEWTGYIDDLRITRGVARYTAAFVPPGSHPTVGP
jgi:hypothetical protein